MILNMVISVYLQGLCFQHVKCAAYCIIWFASLYIACVCEELDHVLSSLKRTMLVLAAIQCDTR